jgi:hypothetical protein
MKITYKFWSLIESIKSWASPQQAWLLKEIPRDYCENDELLWLVSRAILVRFVEKENGLLKREPENEKQRLEDAALARAYLLVYEQIPKILAKISAVETFLGKNFLGEGARRRMEVKKLRLKQQVELMKTKVCVLVAHNRTVLWT